MPITTVVKKRSSRGKRKTSSRSRSVKNTDMSRREYRLSKMKHGTERRKAKYDYKLKTAEQRAGVTKTGMRSGAAASTVGVGANSDAVREDYSDPGKVGDVTYVTNNNNYYTITEQADGGIGGGNKSPGTTGTNDDGALVPRR